MDDRTERTVEELDVTEVCTKLQTACKNPKLPYCLYNTKFSVSSFCHIFFFFYFPAFFVSFSSSFSAKPL